MSAPYELEIKRACDGNTLDQVRAFEIYDKVAVEGNEGAQQLAQAVIARFNLYPDVSEKIRLLDLMDILVVNCDSTFHRHLAEEGFFQKLISDRKVQSDHSFRISVHAHLKTWLGSLSGKALEIASDVLGRLSDLKGESPTDHQPGSSNPRASSDQLLNRGPREVITFQTPRLEKRLCRFLLSSYVQAGDIVRTSRRVRWFSLQAIHIARQAFHLIIRFNDFIGPDGPTEEQYDEGMELDDALEELEDKIDELEKLELDEAIEAEADHKYDLARLYQIFFSTRDFYLNGRDYTTDPVLRRLANSDHASLVLARRLQARGPHTEGFQILDVHDDDDDDGSNQGHISDVSASQAGPDDAETVPVLHTDSAPPPPKGQQASTATPASGGNLENLVLIEPQSQEAAETTQTTTTEGQQQEEMSEAATEEVEDEETQAAIAKSLGAALPTRSRDNDDDDSPPEHQFKCTVPGCGRKFSEHHELKAHTHEHDDKPYKCSFKDCDRSYSTQRERDRHVSIHRLTRQFGLPGFGSPGDSTTTETAAVGPKTVTQTQATDALPSVLISTSSSSIANPSDSPVVENPAQV